MLSSSAWQKHANNILLNRINSPQHRSVPLWTFHKLLWTDAYHRVAQNNIYENGPVSIQPKIVFFVSKMAAAALTSIKSKDKDVTELLHKVQSNSDTVRDIIDM